MLKVLFLLECDGCCKTLPYVGVSPNLDPEEWESWANELPLHARRTLRWRVEDDLHTCPECLFAMGELDEDPDSEREWYLA